jgi:DNA-binding MarR family transcriptional regulator
VARPDPSTANTIACVNAWHLLRMAHARVEQELSRELATACGLSVTEFDALFYLRLHAAEALRIGDLQLAVDLSQPALSRLVARLEQRGLLCREPVPEDARAATLRLTPAGEDVLNTASRVHTRVVHEVFASRFTDDEQATLLGILGRIAR